MFKKVGWIFLLAKFKEIETIFVPNFRSFNKAKIKNWDFL